MEGHARRVRGSAPWASPKGSVLLTLASVALVISLLVPNVGGSLSSAPRASPPVPRGASPLPAALTPVWGPVRTASHLEVAPAVGRIDLRDLPSTSPAPATPWLQAPPTPGGFVHTSGSGIAPLAAAHPSAQVVGPGFEGLNDSQCGCAPPDVIDAVGPTQVVEMVNLWLQVWTPQGTPVRGVSASEFFGSGTDFLSDPRVIYDNESGRWFASIFDAGPSGTGLVRFAVSASSDASGTWTVYSSVVSPSGEFPDQPILGVSDHLLSFGGNMFSETTSAFYGSEYWVVDKAALLNGSTAAVESWGPDPNYLSIHPVQSLGPTSVQYFVSSTSASATTVTLWSVSGVPPTATSAMTNLTVASYTTSPVAHAPGGGQIDSADTRVETAVWQSGHLWMAFDSQCTPSGDSTARACVRVDEIATATATVLQDFDYGISGLDIYYPALALDHVGDVTLVFGYSSSTVYPSGGVTGQAASDPAGTLESYRTIVAGSGSMTCAGPCRYGDYFGAGVDPSGSTVWVSAEYWTPLHAWDSWLAPVRTSGPAQAELGSLPTAADVGSPVQILLTGSNVTCSAEFDLYCAASVPLGDGGTASIPCSTGPSSYAVVHTYTFPGAYTIGAGGYLSVYSTPGCTGGSETLNLTLPALPIVVSPALSMRLTGSPAHGADLDQPFSFSADVAGGRAPFQYQWTGLPAGCSSPGGAGVNCTATTLGSSLVEVNTTDSNGVSLLGTLAFTVSPALTNSITSTATLLDVGQSVTFGATVAGGTGTYSTVWSGLPNGCEGGNVSFVVCTPTSSGTPSGPTTYRVNETTSDTNGFSLASPTITVEVYPALEVSIAAPGAGSTGQAAHLVATVTGGSPLVSVTWAGLPAGCSTTNATELNCTPTSGGSFEITVTVVDAARGSANATIPWSVTAPAGASSEPLLIGAIVGAAAVVVVAVAVLWRRSGRRGAPPAPPGPPAT